MSATGAGVGAGEAAATDFDEPRLFAISATAAGFVSALPGIAIMPSLCCANAPAAKPTTSDAPAMRRTAARAPRFIALSRIATFDDCLADLLITALLAAA